MDIERYRKDASCFLSELDKEYYLHYSGQKDELNVAGIYSRYINLFSHDNYMAIRDLAEESDGEDRKRYVYLLKFCAEGLIENSVKELVDEIGEVEAKTTVKIEGRDISFRFSEVLLSNEGDKQKRDYIDSMRNSTVEKIFNPSLKKYWTALHDEAKKLGFNSYRDLFSFLKQQDFGRLEAQMDRLIAETQGLYEEHFGNLLFSEMGLKLSESRRSDFAFLRRAKKFDRFFKKEMLVDVFKDTLLSMGIDLDRQSNIILDVEERQNKSPRAFCSTVRIPDEIYLVVMPKGGQDDYEAMFHEGGHSEHFANASPGLEFEFKFLGDNSVTEGYAFSLEHLIQNSRWLMDFLRMSPEEARTFTYFSNISKLWFCRRYAGKLKFELILHDGSPVDGKDIIYEEILSSTNMMRYSATDYLKDVDDGFYCTSYIRAWIFEAQLKDYMHRKFGYGWFKEKKAGDFLRDIWSYGQKYDPVEVLAQLDFKELDIGYLINSLKEEIKANM